MGAGPGRDDVGVGVRSCSYVGMVIVAVTPIRHLRGCSRGDVWIKIVCHSRAADDRGCVARRLLNETGSCAVIPRRSFIAGSADDSRVSHDARLLLESSVAAPSRRGSATIARAATGEHRTTTEASVRPVQYVSDAFSAQPAITATTPDTHCRELRAVLYDTLWTTHPAGCNRVCPGLFGPRRLQPPDHGHHPPALVDDPADRGQLLGVERLHLQELRLGEQRGERIV